MSNNVPIFQGIARSVAESLRQLGYSVAEYDGPVTPQRGKQTIVFGLNGPIPANAIIYQLEQLGSPWITDAYMQLLRNHIVWDFSPYNVAELVRRGCRRTHLCRIGTSPGAKPSSLAPAKHIDVLFYGALNERRKAVLDSLRSRGVVVHDKVTWGPALNDLIARSKIVLNVHFYPDAVLEMVRLAPVIDQGAFVVSEKSADPALEKTLEGGLVIASYDKLVPVVMAQLAKTQAERDASAALGAAAFRKLSHKDEIARCLATSLPALKPRPSKPVRCYINNYNRLAWTRSIVEQIRRLGGEPVIVDNASTYPPLLTWYASNPCRVERVGQNLGRQAPWLSGLIDREVRNGDLYVVTDPDLDLSRVPDDALSVLTRGLDNYGVRKAGFSLELNDVPQQLLDMRYVNNSTLGQHEAQFWRTRLDPEFWKANVDTTFALYRYNGPVPMQHISFFEGVRADRPYTARHLPWYRTKSDFDDEDKYYMAHHKNGTWYKYISEVRMTRIDTILALIRKHGYKRYLEIGCASNACFSKIPIEKIGVDPVSGGTHRMTSDRFFAQLGKSAPPFDIVFIDGDHRHDQVLRDVENSLKVLAPNGCIVMHDCLPPDLRHESPSLCGTVWRAFVKLRTRLDLDCVVGDYDYGVGVVRRKRNATPIDVAQSMDSMTYQQFGVNRVQWMRPMSFESILELK